MRSARPRYLLRAPTALAIVAAGLAIGLSAPVARGGPVPVKPAAQPQSLIHDPAPVIDLGDGAAIEIDGPAARSSAGWSVADAGDVNNDGLADVVIGAPDPLYVGASGPGAAYVVFGTVLPAHVDLADIGVQGFKIQGAASGDEAGYSVAGAGDVNHDDHADVIVGADQASGYPGRDSGIAYLVFGSESPETVNLANLGGRGFRMIGGTGDAQAGFSVGGAGDQNGDGTGDLIVGEPATGSGGWWNPGAAYVVFGRGPGTVDMARIVADRAGYRIDGYDDGDQTGISVAAAGDLDGAAPPDLVVGANYAGPYYEPQDRRYHGGKAWVVFGRASPGVVDLASLGSQGYRADGAARGDEAGLPIAGPGDVNGDGWPDVAVGAPGADPNGRDGAGAVYLVRGGSSASVDLASLGGRGYRVDGASPGDHAGPVAGAGDYNGDGLRDLIVGAPTADNNGRADSGSAYLLYGKRSVRRPTDLLYLRETQGLRIDGAAPGDQAGYSVSGAGDMNGDGHPDLIIGATYADGADGARTGSGVVYIVPGDGG